MTHSKKQSNRSSFRAKHFLYLLAFLFLSSIASAQTQVVWTGNANSDWNNPSNWNLPLVPNTLGFSVLIPNTTIAPKITGSVTIHHLIILSGGELTVENTGALNLSTGLPNVINGVIYNLGTIENYGSINLSNDPTGATTYSYAIQNNGPFDNYGSLVIENSRGGGMNNTGTFRNRGGNIEIGSTGTISGIGLLVEDGTVLNQNYLGFFGSLDIDRTTEDAIEISNAGFFIQTSGTLNIGINATVAKYGIDNDGDFRADGGTINIARSTWSGINNRANADFVNISSIIDIGNLAAVAQGINNSGTITNDRSIRIMRANNNGILNTSTGTINNGASGSISIGTQSAVGEAGITNNGSITNDDGTITIKLTTGPGLFNDGNGSFFHNLNGATLNIGTSGGSIGAEGMKNRWTEVSNNASSINIENTGTVTAADGEGLYMDLITTFDNMNGAVINIGQNSGTIKQTGVYIIGGSFLTNNNSQIVIDNTEQSALEVPNVTFFENINNAVIQIGQNDGNIGGNGILLGDGINGSTTILRNIGSTISIDNVAQSGILNLVPGEIENTNGGQISIGLNGGIDNIGLHAIENEKNLVNSAILRIANTTDHGIKNDWAATLTNQNAGQIHIGVDGGPTNIGKKGIWNNADISNDNSGLHIDNTTSHGLEVFDNGSFSNLNNGEVKIGLLGTNSIGGKGILNENIFLNDASNIQVKHTQDDGIHVNDGAFENNNTGEVSVFSSLGEGIHSGFGAEFINNSTVYVGDIAEWALSLGSNGGDYATFVNDNGIAHIDGQTFGFLYFGGILSIGVNGPGELTCPSSSNSSMALYGATLEMEVQGPTPITEHSLISGTPSTTIQLEKNGIQASLSMDINYTPNSDERIVILNAGTLTGTFGSISPALPNGWSIDYSVPGEVALVYTLPDIRD